MSLPPLEDISEFESIVDSVSEAFHTASISETSISGSLWGAFYTSSGSCASVHHVTWSAGDHFFEATAPINGSISAFFIPIKRVIE